MKRLLALMVLCSSMSGVSIAQELRYRLSVPDGWDHWVLFDDPGAAWGCYAHADDPDTKSYIDDRVGTEHMATYRPGAIAVLIGDPFTGNSDHGESFAYELRIVSGED